MGLKSPFPPSEKEGYTSNRDVPYQSVTFDVMSVWLTNGIPWKTPLLLTRSSALRKPASPPTPVGTEDRTGLRQRWQPPLFRTVGMDNTGKAYSKKGNATEATSCVRRYHVEITHMDWPRAVLHMGVSEVYSASLGWDNYTTEMAEGLCQWKTRAHREGSRTAEENTCGFTWRGITTHGHLDQHKGWPWANMRMLDLASGPPPHLNAEGAGGTSTGFTAATELRNNKSTRIWSIEGNGAASMIDTVQVGHPGESTREDTGSIRRL